MKLTFPSYGKVLKAVRVYYFALEDDSSTKYHPAKKSKQVRLADFPQLDLFLHKCNQWRLSEATTGLVIAYGDTQQKAIKAAKDKLKNYTQAQTQEIIAERKKEGYVAPAPMWRLKWLCDEGTFTLHVNEEFHRLVNEFDNDNITLSSLPEGSKVSKNWKPDSTF